MHSSSSHAGMTIANRPSDVGFGSMLGLGNDALFRRARKVRGDAEHKLAFRRHRAVHTRPDLELQERLSPGDLLRVQIDLISGPEGLKKLPTGMGWLSVWVVLREFMDPKRFRNRRQVGCFTGLVPSEASTGESFRQGSVTKVGNPVVRAILVEMAWRLVRYQPNCRAIKPRLRVLKDRKAGPRARKKAIVAAARVLAVDLWRLATGQTTVENLGFAV